MKSFKEYLKEAETPKIKPPPAPPIPAQDGEPNPGEKVVTNPDGTRTYSGGFGIFTYDKSGKAIKYTSPQFGGAGGEVDLTSGDQTTTFSQGPMSASQTTTPGGYVKQSDVQADLGTATLGQKTVGPDIAAGQLAGTTTNTVTNNQTGQAQQQVQGVAFGGASGANVGKNYVGASTDQLAQHAANSVVGINPDDAATPPQARVAAPPAAPKTEKDVVDLNAKYNSKKPQAPAEDMHRLRKLSGITEKDIDEAPEPPKAGAATPAMPPAGGSTQPAPKPANPPPMPAAGQDMDLTKVDNDTLFGKYQQLQSTINFMAPQGGDKQMAASADPASQNMLKGMQDQLVQADKELKKRGYTDQQLKPAAAAAKPLDQSDANFKEDLEAMLKIARLR